jgi:hypothetical protein
MILTFNVFCIIILAHPVRFIAPLLNGDHQSDLPPMKIDLIPDCVPGQADAVSMM